MSSCLEFNLSNLREGVVVVVVVVEVVTGVVVVVIDVVVIVVVTAARYILYINPILPGLFF